MAVASKEMFYMSSSSSSMSSSEKYFFDFRFRPLPSDFSLRFFLPLLKNKTKIVNFSYFEKTFKNLVEKVDKVE